MKIFSIIVCYNPDFHRLNNLLEKLKESNLGVILIDNGSNLTHQYDNIFFDSFFLIKSNDNLGIARAQNLGIMKAIDLNAESIIFFDQDSTIDSDFIDNLICDFKKIQTISNDVAAIGPRFLDEKKGFYFPALKFNTRGLIDKILVENINEPIEVSFLISSGTLVFVKALKEIGLMREEFFIDFVDTEWCFRALSKGYKLYMSDKAIMKHSVGEDTLRFLNFNIPIHSGYRRYYRLRNLFFMYNMQHIPKKLTIRLFIVNSIHQLIFILIKRNKWDYIKYYVKAIIDGLEQSKNLLEKSKKD